MDGSDQLYTTSVEGVETIFNVVVGSVHVVVIDGTAIETTGITVLVGTVTFEVPVQPEIVFVTTTLKLPP